MDKEELIKDGKQMSPWQQHKFLILVGLAVVIALLMTAISISLYNTSGTAQLDLSRPGYQSVREKVSDADQFPSFPSSGPLDQASLDRFEKLYSEQTQKLTSIDSFGGNVMSNKALSIDAPAQ